MTDSNSFWFYFYHDCTLKFYFWVFSQLQRLTFQNLVFRTRRLKLFCSLIELGLFLHFLKSPRSDFFADLRHTALLWSDWEILLAIGNILFLLFGVNKADNSFWCRAHSSACQPVHRLFYLKKKLKIEFLLAGVGYQRLDNFGHNKK